MNWRWEWNEFAQFSFSVFPVENFLADFDIKFYCWFCRNTKVLQFPYKFSYLEIDFLFFGYSQKSSLKLDVVISINLGGFFLLLLFPSPLPSSWCRAIFRSLFLEASTFILDDFVLFVHSATYQSDSPSSNLVSSEKKKIRLSSFKQQNKIKFLCLHNFF